MPAFILLIKLICIFWLTKKGIKRETMTGLEGRPKFERQEVNVEMDPLVAYPLPNSKRRLVYRPKAGDGSKLS